MILNFPHNPTTAIVNLAFMKRVVDFARENGILVVHDLAYADICFDGYKAPSIMQVPGAKEMCVEFFTLSKSYNMPGWRVGFCVGNPDMIAALTRLKSYFDYGIFAPVQVASIAALNGPQDCVTEIVSAYRKRRDALCEGLTRAGWPVEKPKATMFVWAPIPEPFREMGSLEFSKFLLKEAKVAVSPGVGFGADGDGFVRFALIENEHRTRQAIRGIKQALVHAPASKVRRIATA
jgi:alanine-synthesizing transaminase